MKYVFPITYYISRKCWKYAVHNFFDLENCFATVCHLCMQRSAARHVEEFLNIQLTIHFDIS